MRETSLAAVVVVLIAAVAGVAVVGGTTPGDGGLPALADTPETDDTVTRIDLSANGSAVWTVRYRTRLRTDADLAAYREFQATFRNDTAAYESSFRDRIAPVVVDAAATTDREMRLADVTATTSIQRVPRRWGVVAYRFRWSNFSAAGPDGSLRAGDVFAGGYYLAANDTLVVTAPQEYRVTRVEPSPDGREDGRARWTGQRSFADGRPLVVAAPPTPTASPTATLSPTATPSPSPSPTATAPPTTQATTTPASDEGGGGLVVPLAIVAVIALLVGGFAATGRGPSWLPGGGPTDPGGPGAPDDAAGTGPTDDATGRTPSDTEQTADATDAGTVDDATTVDDTADTGTVDDATTVDDTADAGTVDDATADDAAETESSNANAADTEPTDDTPDATDATTAAGVAGDAAGEPPEPYASVLADLRPPLTDEERVAQALAREHGRMRQSALADSLEWSASKTSRVLSRMADDDRVEKLRVGRENVVDLVVDDP